MSEQVMTKYQSTLLQICRDLVALFQSVSHEVGGEWRDAVEGRVRSKMMNWRGRSVTCCIENG